MKKKSNFKILKFIPVIVIILLLVVGLVYMNQSQESSLTPNNTPIPTETPVPTETPTPTPEPTPTITPVSDEGLQYKFDLYVETYKYDNSLTDEQLNDEATKAALFKWIYDCGYSAGKADEEKADGCTNALLPEYVEWCSTDANEYIVEGTTQNDTNQNTEGLSQELIDKGLHYNEEGALVDANGNYSMDNDDDLYENSQNGITGPDDPLSNESAHEAGQAIHERFNGSLAQETHDRMAEILGRG